MRSRQPPVRRSAVLFGAAVSAPLALSSAAEARIENVPPSAAKQPKAPVSEKTDRAVPPPPVAPTPPPSQVRGSDGLTPGQRGHIQRETRASEVVAPAPQPQPAPPPEPEPQPQPAPPSQQRGWDGLTPGQRRLIDEDRRASAATPPPEPPVVQPPSPPRGADGLTPGQRRLIDEDRRAAATQPPADANLTPAQRHLIDQERRAAAAQPPTPVGPPVEAEVMNWNLGRGASIDHGQGTDPNEVDEVARVIAEEQPDIVTLQEVYTQFSYVDGVRKNFENDVHKILRIIEEETGVQYHAAPAPARPNWELDDNIFRDRRAGFFGNVILSREPFEDPYIDVLPWDESWPRVLQGAVTTVDGVEVSVHNTHLTEDGPQRPAQLEEAFRTAGRPARPTIFAGDFNVGYEGTDPYAWPEGFTRLTERRGDRCNGTGRDQIDSVYGANGVTGSQRPGFECGPSDHPYQVVDVEIERD